MFTRNENGEINLKSICNEIYGWAVTELDRDVSKRRIGVLLCEGDETSVDMAVYQLVFPDLLVVPVGGCTNVIKFTNALRKRLRSLKMYCFGIVDRDSLSKQEIKKLYESSGVNTTKLPFIENLISTPEVIKCVCDYKQVDFEPFLQSVQAEVMKHLWRTLKDTIPINISVEKWEVIRSLYMRASTSRKEVSKEVGPNNVLYVFRDKGITSIIASKLGIKGKHGYYSLIIELVKIEEYQDELRHAFSRFIPKLEFYEDFED
jgi:hypothetical protein